VLWVELHLGPEMLWEALPLELAMVLAEWPKELVEPSVALPLELVMVLEELRKELVELLVVLQVELAMV
jgi:hypothetical protein